MFTREFWLTNLSAALFFAAFGLTLPALPRYVVEVLGRGDVAVGLVYGAYAVAAVSARPIIGRIGDRAGRRRLLMIGCSIAAAGLFTHLVALTMSMLLAARLLTGLGQGAVLVAASTLVIDHAPPRRRGEAASYFMVALQVGMGTGAFVGELVLDRSTYAGVWVTSSLLSLSVLVLSLGLSTGRPIRTVGAVEKVGLLHRASVRPGIVMWFGFVGYIGYLTFVPLFADEIGVQQLAPLFLLSSAVLIVVRIAGARIPDLLGVRRSGSLALAIMGSGLMAMGMWKAPIGLYVATVVMSAGSALVYPTLILAVTRNVPEAERGRAMATFTLFLDLATAVSPSLLGFVAAARSYAAVFVTAGFISLIGLALLWTWSSSWQEAASTAEP